MRIGILGAARICPDGIVTPARLTGARLVSLAARDRTRAESFGAEYGVERILDSYAEVIADPNVEMIYNPLPNALHAPWNLAAIAANKHVLSEKPFAANAQEAKQVRDAGYRAGLAVADGFHYVYHPVTQRLHALLESGELGELRTVDVTLTVPAPEDGDPRWSLPLAGGALMDLGCYGLHAHRILAPWAGGEPAVASARGGQRAGLPEVDEWVSVDLSFPSGATGVVRCNMAGERTLMTYTVVGTRGNASVANFVRPDLNDRLFVATPAGERVEHLGRRSSYTYQLEAFAAHVRTGAAISTGSNDAVATMRLVDDCYRALGLQLRESMPVQ